MNPFPILLQTLSASKQIIQDFSILSSGFCLFSLNILYICKSIEGMPSSYRIKMFSCFALNAFYFISFLLTHKSPAKKTLSALKEEFLMVFTFITFITNIQIFWKPLLLDFPSSSLAGSILIYAQALVPMLYYSSLAYQILHWMSATFYSIFTHLTTESFFPELVIAYSLSIIMLLYCIANPSGFTQTSQNSPNISISEIPSKFLSLILDQTEELYFVINKDLHVVTGSKAFNDTFNGHGTHILEKLNQINCTKQIYDIVGHNEERLASFDSFSSLSVDVISLSSSKMTTYDRNVSLKTICELLFKHSTILKENGIGWDIINKRSQVHITEGCLGTKTVKVKFSYIEDDGKDFLIFKVEPNKNSSSLSMTQIASIIHELRTPLNGTIFLLQQAMESNLEPADIKYELLEPSLESAKRLNFVINDILDFAQLLEGKFKVTFEAFDLQKAITQPVKIISALAKSKGITLELSIDPNVPKKITTDQNRLLQIIYNLLGNAVKFTKEGSIHLSISPARTRQYIEFTVKDTGYGIKREDLGKLFHAFEKLDNWHDNKVGSGLGLCISNAIVKALGGAGLSVHSEYEKGSTFSFIIEDKSIEDDNTPKGSPRYSTFAPAHLSGKPLQGSIPESNRLQRIPTGEMSLREMVLKGQVKKGSFRRRSVVPHIDSSEVLPDVMRGHENPTVHFDFNNPSQHSPQTFPSKKAKGPATFESSYETNYLQAPYVRENMHTAAPYLERNRASSCTRKSVDSIQSRNCCPQVIGVDDEPMNLMILQMICNSLDLEFRGFTNGEEVIKYFVNRKECSKCLGYKSHLLILMDCNMPVKDGFETSKDLQALMKNQIIPRIPIYACTADDSVDMKYRIFQNGMDGTIFKPVKKEQLQSLISKICSRNYQYPVH